MTQVDGASNPSGVAGLVGEALARVNLDLAGSGVELVAERAGVEEARTWRLRLNRGVLGDVSGVRFGLLHSEARGFVTTFEGADQEPPPLAADPADLYDHLAAVVEALAAR